MQKFGHLPEKTEKLDILGFILEIIIKGFIGYVAVHFIIKFW